MINQVLSCKRMEQFTEYLFDDPAQVPKAALILKAILEARSPRLCDLSGVLPGKPQANYNKKRELMEKMVALVLLAYAMGLLLGEAVRDQKEGGLAVTQASGGRAGSCIRGSLCC